MHQVLPNNLGGYNASAQDTSGSKQCDILQLMEMLSMHRYVSSKIFGYGTQRANDHNDHHSQFMP